MLEVALSPKEVVAHLTGHQACLTGPHEDTRGDL
jgi:hypothetical protein